MLRGEALRSYSDRVRLLNPLSAGAPLVGTRRTRWSRPDWALPTAVSKFFEAFHEPLCLTGASSLVTGHTLAPYFASTLSPPRQEAFFQRLLAPSLGPRRPLLAIALSEWFAKCAVVCPKCDDESIKALGFSHVQRHWLLPFLTRCHIHSVPLLRCTVWTPAGSHSGEPVPMLPGRVAAGRTLTVRCRKLLSLSEPNLLDELSQLLVSRGYATESGQVRQAKVARLAQAVVAQSVGRYEHPELDRLLTSQATVSKLLTPLGRTRASLHPVVALALQDVLEQLPRASPQVSTVRRRADVASAVQTALSMSKTPTAAAKVAGVSVTTAVAHAVAMGLPVVRRPKRLHEPLRKEILALLAKGKQVSEVAELTGVSQSSVYRTVAANPIVRDARDAQARAAERATRQGAWSELMVANPSASATQLRRQAPELYAYLYRWARAWLLASGRNRPKFDSPRLAVVKAQAKYSRIPEGADEELGRRVAAAKSTDLLTMPSRQTRYALLAAAGRPNGASTLNGIASAALETNAEPQRSFVVRRLLAAAIQLQIEGVPLVAWKVARRARLRSEVLRAAEIDIKTVMDAARAEYLRRM
jgi:DNA-binding transcriptional ArsR family regulator